MLSLFAYLDPGTGSIFAQVIIGIVAGGAFVFRTFVGKILSKIRGAFTKRRINAVEEE